MSLVFTEVPLRLLGFGFAMEEAMRYNFAPGSISLAHNVGCGFVVAHVVYAVLTSEGTAIVTLMTGVESLCWEALASYLIPAVTTFYVCRATDNMLAKNNVPSSVKTWGAFVAGVCLLPVYLIHVDPFVTSLVSSIFSSAV